MKKLSVLLALLLVLSLSVPAVASAASAEPVRVFTLNGTTGFGLAGLIAENKDGGTPQEYSYTASIANKSLIQDKTKLKARRAGKRRL